MLQHPNEITIANIRHSEIHPANMLNIVACTRNEIMIVTLRARVIFSGEQSFISVLTSLKYVNRLSSLRGCVTCCAHRQRNEFSRTHELRGEKSRGRPDMFTSETAPSLRWTRAFFCLSAQVNRSRDSTR